jgi:hypothetical protein
MIPQVLPTVVMGEPQVGNRGFNLMIGVAKRF